MNVTFNTKQEGVFHFLYLQRKSDYIGICLNLNIIEYGKDLKRLEGSLEEAAFSHLEAVRKGNLDDKYLNTSAPKKYWDRYFAECKRVEKIEKIIKDATPTNWGSLGNSEFFTFTQRPYFA